MNKTQTRHFINGAMCYISSLFNERDALLEDKQMIESERNIELARLYFGIYSVGIVILQVADEGKKLFPDQIEKFDELQRFVSYYQ